MSLYKSGVMLKQKPVVIEVVEKNKGFWIKMQK